MAGLRPKYITFDCYGTLIDFQMGPTARTLYADRIQGAAMDQFVKDFAGYRLDEVLGEWKPFRHVVENSLRRTCARNNVDYRESDGEAMYAAVPTWEPHPDVVEPLKRVAAEIPLVILSNSMIDLIPHSVKKLEAPFHAVYTAEEAQAYKPRMQAFEYMFDQLGCDPKDIMHVSSSFRYDQQPATDLGIGARVFVSRGHEPSSPFYRDVEIPHVGCLPAVVGL
jgi:2-haloacid dehalogenase